MTTVAGMIRKIEAYNFVSEVEKILLKYKDAIAEANKLQWKMGERAGGEKIGKYASKKYANAKVGLNSLAGLGNMDLILTKKTVESITVDITSDSILFKIGDDEHSLESRFGSDILGLSPKSKKAFIPNFLLPELLTSIRTNTGMA